MEQEQLTILTITEEEFWENYKPIPNHLDDNASWNGCMYETYDPEKQFCFDLAQKENRVWTIIEVENEDLDPDEDPDEEDDDDDEIYQPSCFVIVSGFHWINRLGFLVTEVPYEEEIEVKIED